MKGRNGAVQRPLAMALVTCQTFPPEPFFDGYILMWKALVQADAVFGPRFPAGVHHLRSFHVAGLPVA